MKGKARKKVKNVVDTYMNKPRFVSKNVKFSLQGKNIFQKFPRPGEKYFSQIFPTREKYFSKISPDGEIFKNFPRAAARARG
jgi:hypothetical protein